MIRVDNHKKLGIPWIETNIEGNSEFSTIAGGNENYFIELNIKSTFDTSMHIVDIYGESKLMSLPGNEWSRFDKIYPIKEVNIPIMEEGGKSNLLWSCYKIRILKERR